MTTFRPSTTTFGATPYDKPVYYPSEFSTGAGYPTTTGYPSTNFPAATYSPEWSRFGGFPSWNNTFSGYPWNNWWNTWNTPYTGGAGYDVTTPINYQPWSNVSNIGGMMPWTSNWNVAPWSRGTTSMMPFNPSSMFRDLERFERSFFNDFDRSMRTVEREMNFLRNMANWRGTTPAATKEFTTSMVQLPARPTSSLEYYTFQNPIRFDAEGRRWFRLCFDLPSFKPEEIKVTYYSKATPAPYVEIIASHDVKEAKEHAIKRTYERKYYFPADLSIPKEYFDKLDFKSHVSNDGVLYVEALLPSPTTEEINRERQFYPVWSAPVKVERRDM